MKKYSLFEKWSKILDWVLDSVEKFPKSVRLTISNRVANLALDVMQQIVSAIYRKKRLHYLYNINLNIEQLRVLYRICHQRKYISSRQYEYIISELNDAGKMTGGWIKSETVR